MKKIRFVLPLLLTFSLLTGCGGQRETGPAPFDPAADAETLLNTEGLFTGTLEEVDQSTACALYGIDEATVESCKVYVGNVGVSLEELAIFTLSSEDAAQTALQALTYRLEDQKEASANYADYLKDELSKLDSAVTERRGNTVLLLVCADYDAAEPFLKGE